MPCLNVDEREGGTNHCCQAVDTLAWGGIRTGWLSAGQQTARALTRSPGQSLKSDIVAGQVVGKEPGKWVRES